MNFLFSLSSLIFFIFSDPLYASSKEDIEWAKDFTRWATVFDPREGLLNNKPIAVLDGGFFTRHSRSSRFCTSFLTKDICSDAFNPRFKDFEDINEKLFYVNSDDIIDYHICLGEPHSNHHGTSTCHIIHQLAPSCSLIPIFYYKNDPEIVISALEYAKKFSILNLSITFSPDYYKSKMNEGVKKKLIELANKNDMLLILAAGNSFFDLDDSTDYFRDILDIIDATKENVILVGATMRDNNPNEDEKLEIYWEEEANPFGDKLRGTNRPGKKEEYQNRFLVAPAFVFPEYDSQTLFGGTSSANPIVSAIASTLWSEYPDKSALEIGKALLMGASFEKISHPPYNKMVSYKGTLNDYNKEYYGRGMIHYLNARKVLNSK